VIDVKNGYVLVIDGEKYTVLYVAEWEDASFDSSFAKMATKTTTREKEVFSNGKGEIQAFGDPLMAFPLDSVTPELKRSIGLEAVYQLKQTFVGDETGFLHVFVEAQKK